MKKRTVCLGILLLLATGCATAIENSGKDIKEEPSKFIKVGLTTREDIVKSFGEPSKTSAMDGSEELVYESRKVETPTYLGGLVINEAGKAVTLKSLKVVIQNGVVQSYKYEANGE